MDEIVAAVYFQGAIFIFTKFGQVWRMAYDAIYGPTFHLVNKMELHP